MKIFSIGICKSNEKPSKLLCSESDLSSFGYFQRSSIQEFINFSSITIIDRTEVGQRHTVEEQNMCAHVHKRAEGFSSVIFTDKEYPSRVAYSLLLKLGDEFISQNPIETWKVNIIFPSLKRYLLKYQDPQQADSIMKVQKELDETKIIMHKTIESVLQRGEKLDNLVDRSENLSAQSKLFYTSAKKTNSCCNMM